MQLPGLQDRYKASTADLLPYNLDWLQDYKGSQMTAVEFERVENIQRFTLNNAHYFCETVDISRPFPSQFPPSEPSWEFVWNRWLATAMRQLGLHQHCPHLLQVQFSLWISRQSVLRSAERLADVCLLPCSWKL